MVMDAPVGRPLISAAVKTGLAEVGTLNGAFSFALGVEAGVRGVFCPLGGLVDLSRGCSVSVAVGALMGGDVNVEVGMAATGVYTVGVVATGSVGETAPGEQAAVSRITKVRIRRLRIINMPRSYFT
jgi:hypothetical protein